MKVLNIVAIVAYFTPAILAKDKPPLRCTPGETGCNTENDNDLYFCDSQGFWSIRKCSEGQRCVLDPTPHCVWGKAPVDERDDDE